MRNSINKKLVYKYNCWWNKKQNPYCPKCRNHLSNEVRYDFCSDNEKYNILNCMACKHDIYLTDDSGNHLSPIDAINKLRSNKKNLSN